MGHECRERTLEERTLSGKEAIGPVSLCSAVPSLEKEGSGYPRAQLGGQG